MPVTGCETVGQAGDVAVLVTVVVPKRRAIITAQFNLPTVQATGVNIE
jgi:hypothetical protein